ncbi:MAG TPA: sensor histidine kinase [Myxococcales bacterium]|nr:sensor histidine kinase [Myxococcales bacterium]
MASEARTTAPAARMREPAGTSADTRILKYLRLLTYVRLALGALLIGGVLILEAIARTVGAVELVIVVCCYAGFDCLALYLIAALKERKALGRVELERLHGKVREIAAVEERNRLAREIHDGLGAVLSSVVIQSEYLLNMIDGSEVRAKLTGSNEARAAIVPILRKEIADLHGAAEESMDELRRSLRMMQEDFDLVSALEEACKVAGARQRLDVRFTRTGRELPVGAESALALFRVLQESLTNVAKHCGRGTRVDVDLAFGDRAATLSIQDDGPGFALPEETPEVAPAGHYGLANMRERAAKVRGTLAVASAPGHGTRVQLHVHALEEREP